MYFVIEWTNDADVVAAFTRIAKSKRTQKPPEQILIHIYENNSWNSADVAFLAQLDVAEYVRIFKMQLGDDHRRVVKSALGFGKFINPEPDYVTIVRKATAALKLIAQESTINKLRVMAHIQLNSEAADSEADE